MVLKPDKGSASLIMYILDHNNNIQELLNKYTDKVLNKNP